MSVVRVHHLNCGSMRLRFGREFDGHRGWLDGSLTIVIHCLLIETETAGLVVVDTGYGTREVENPALVPSLSRFATRPVLDPRETMAAHVRRLGFQAEDVQHVVFTHLDHDHMAGIHDFPQAMAHVYGPEWEEAQRGQGRMHRMRYRPAHLDAHPRWTCYPEQGGEAWLGLPGAQPLHGLQGEVVLVPLPGHSAGHCGVAVRAADGWLLHAGDAYMIADEMKAPPYGDASTGFFTRFIQADGLKRQRSLDTLRQLRRDRQDGLTVFCAHDQAEYEALAAACGGNPCNAIT